MLTEESRRKRNAAHDRWDRENTKQIKLKLNIRTDCDIISHLKNKSSVQGYIKKLIRSDMSESSPEE